MGVGLTTRPRSATNPVKRLPRQVRAVAVHRRSARIRVQVVKIELSRGLRAGNLGQQLCGGGASGLLARPAVTVWYGAVLGPCNPWT